MVNIDKIFQIALNVRKDVKAKAKLLNHPGSLSGCCAFASAWLHMALKRNGIKSTICLIDSNGWCHVFLKVKKYIVDITATQFGNYDTVEIFHESKVDEREWWWKISKKFNRVCDLTADQKEKGWPHNQMANQKRNKKILL